MTGLRGWTIAKDIPAPVLINFPLPAWATRGEEVDDQDLDKAAREFAEKF